MNISEVLHNEHIRSLLQLTLLKNTVANIQPLPPQAVGPMAVKNAPGPQKAVSSATPLAERDPNVQSDTSKAKAASNTSKKRKSEYEHVDLDEIDPGDEIKWSANQIRSKIRQYLNSGEMKVGEFQKKIGVSSTSYSHFMRQNGPDKGMYSDTFAGAHDFFRKREIAGLKMPSKKKVATSKTADTTDKSTSDKTSKASTKKSDKDEFDVSDIRLDGEDTDSVPIYDTCNDLRPKIEKHLRDTSASQASMLREFKKSYTNPPPGGLAATSLKTFLSHSGPAHGSHMPIFYAAYVYFEKLRVKQGKPKSKKRQEMEDVWGKKGMESTDMTRPMWMHQSEYASVDKYGKFSIERVGGRM